MRGETEDIDKRGLEKSKTLVGMLLIFVAVLLAYSNTFQSSWHLDDYHSILDNPHLHIEELKPESLYQSFFAAPGGGKYSGESLYRPISCMTFALNWYLGQDDVFGYHVTNLIIHFFSALFIYLCTICILASPNVHQRFEGRAHFIALLASLLWAVHPIQIQAVTYIVQRMASLSAMFCLFSLWLYLQGRNKRTNRLQIFYFIGSSLCYLLALGSKENAIVLPASVALIEILFFQDLSEKKPNKVLVLGGLACVIAITIGLNGFNATGVLSGYEMREFTLIQRLMTQPQVLISYLSQIFLPLPGRFSLEHDVLISRSLLSPWTTLPAMLAVLGLIMTGLMQIRKRPLVAFAILFYFLNHVVESTVIPLELSFEHRNYLPSSFLFIPIAIWIVDTLRWCRSKNHVVSGVAYSGIFILVLFLMGSTFLRNDVWATEKSLWEDAISKAPGQARPYQNLAYQYYEIIGRYDVALSLYKKALTLQAPNPKRTRAQILTNIGVIYGKAGDYEKAFGFYQKALEVSPKQLKPRYNATMALIGMGKWEEALQQVDDLIVRKPEDKDSNNLKGSILLKLKRPEEALLYLQKSLDMDPTYFKALINMGIALFQTGKYDQSESLLSLAHQLAPEQGLPILCLLENSIRANDLKRANIHLQKLHDSVGLDEIFMVLKSIGQNNFLVPISYDILTSFIKENIGTTGNDKEKLFN